MYFCNFIKKYANNNMLRYNLKLLYGSKNGKEYVLTC